MNLPSSAAGGVILLFTLLPSLNMLIRNGSDFRSLFVLVVINVRVKYFGLVGT